MTECTSEEDKETEYSGRRMEASNGVTKAVNIANVLLWIKLTNLSDCEFDHYN